MTTDNSHHHIEQSGLALAESAQRTFEATGGSWTAMRAQIFAVLATAVKPMSVYEIADIISHNKARRTAPNSVYRILDLFVACNLARRIESANAFIVNHHPTCLHDCIYLICDVCGYTTHVDDDSLSIGIRAIAQARGFVPQRPVVEVRGSCVTCQPEAGHEVGGFNVRAKF